MTTLVQQRMAIERQRVFAVLYLTVGLIWVALEAGLGVASSWGWSAWFQIALGILWIGLGLASFHRYRREIGAFIAEHGAEAGKR